MTLKEIDGYFNSFLKKENFPADPSRNGIQIENSDVLHKEIKKVAFAVDACETTVLQAAKENADLLFVHHGLFWGGCETVTGIHYKRLSAFLKNDIALYASHIPLDANHETGNNYGLAFRLEMENLMPFGQWKGMTLGVKGELKQASTVEKIAEKLLRKTACPKLLKFGPAKVKTVAIISGGAGDEHVQAALEGVDLYITGEIGHEDFHSIEELNLNVIAGGHYETETVGVNLVRQKLEKETGIETVFIDVPTSL